MEIVRSKEMLGLALIHRMRSLILDDGAAIADESQKRVVVCILNNA